MLPVIDRMLKRFQAPYYDEGIDEIKIVKPDKFSDMKYYHDIINAMHIPHDNHHHTLSIQQHCKEAFEEIECVTTDRALLDAAWYHDIGKPYVKAFVDSKGNLWVGSNDEGLVKISGKTYTLFTMADGLPSNSVRDITEDKNGNIWIGTSSGVVFIYILFGLCNMPHA